MKQTSLFIAFMLMLQLILPFSAAANSSQTIIYTPLGDSLASGVNEVSEQGLGYVDFIAQALEKDGATVDYTKLYTCPGYASLDVLADFEKNITDTNCKYKTEPTDLTPLQQRIAQSDLITISAGANDVLGNFKKNKVTGQYDVDIFGIPESINQVIKNYVSLLNEIRELNPNAKIIVLGFYNPYPHLTQYKEMIDRLLVDFDSSLESTVKQFNVQYAVVRDLIASDVQTFLPNPENIHLSEAGYKAVAEVMYALVKQPAPTPAPQFADVAETSEWYPYIQAVAAAGIMNGSNGNFLPATPLKRIHVASMVTRMYNYEATAAAPFSDIAGLNEKTRQELDAAYANGIVRGSNNAFSPQANVQRVQLASMLLRAYERQKGTTFAPTKALPFTDTVNLSVEEQRAISFLYENNIVSGRTSTTFAPRANTTRAAAAKIFAGILTMQ